MFRIVLLYPRETLRIRIKVRSWRLDANEVSQTVRFRTMQSIRLDNSECKHSWGVLTRKFLVDKQILSYKSLHSSDKAET